MRRAVRRLPRERRKDVLAAIRAGRAVRDPRDAALAVACAERLAHVRLPGWLLPRSLPRGKRAWLWLLHVVWITVASAIAISTLWSSLTGVWRWVLVGFFAYSAIATPVIVAQTLRAYWNAPAAADKNGHLLALQRGERQTAADQ